MLCSGFIVESRLARRRPPCPVSQTPRFTTHIILYRVHLCIRIHLLSLSRLPTRTHTPHTHTRARATAFISGKGFPRREIVDQFHAAGMKVGSLAGRTKVRLLSVSSPSPLRLLSVSSPCIYIRVSISMSPGVDVSFLSMFAIVLLNYGQISVYVFRRAAHLRVSNK